MTEWREIKIGDLAAPGRHMVVGGPFGSALGRKDYVEAGVPVIRGSQLGGAGSFTHDDLVFVTEEKANRQTGNLAYPGDVVVTQRGTVGQVGRVPNPAPFPRYLLSQSQMKLTVDESKADPQFVYYALLGPSAQSQLHGSTMSAGVPHINLATFREVVLDVPSAATQQGIVNLLGAIDDLIENNRRRIELLEQMARAIHREWFVRLRFPGHEDTVLVDSPLGHIPEGWDAVTIGDVLELRYGKALRASERQGGSVAVVGSSGVVGWHDEYLMAGPAVVVGRKGNVGKVIWVPGHCWPIDTTYYVSTDLPLLYVYEQLARAEFMNSHAAVPGLSREQAYSLPFLRPSDDVMGAYTEMSTTLGATSETLRAQAKKLAAIRDLLLPALVTGQIDVSQLDLDDMEASVA